MNPSLLDWHARKCDEMEDLPSWEHLEGRADVVSTNLDGVEHQPSTLFDVEAVMFVASIEQAETFVMVRDVICLVLKVCCCIELSQKKFSG